LAVLPATFEDDRLRQTLEEFDTVVLMKVGRVFAKVRDLLTELGLKQQAVYVRQVGLPGQQVFYDLDQVGEEDRHYLSMIIVRKTAEGF
jgi:precorrin-2/cobalt-factor-2 C20-methyltransferase